MNAPLRAIAALLLPVPVVAATLTVTRPEEVGLSGERLGRIRALVQSHIAAKDLSGAVTLVARRGRVVHLEAHGLADIDARKPMTTGALFRMASMTKPLTAVSILMLMEEGKLLLSDPVSKYIPRVSQSKSRGVAIAERSRRCRRDAGRGPPRDHDQGSADTHLGPRQRLFGAGGRLRAQGEPADRRARSTSVCDASAKLPLNFEPGSQWEYSPGTGFDTLGRIIELQSGMNLAQFFKARIFDPLGMKDSFFDIPAARRGDSLSAYARSDKGLAPSRRPLAEMSARRARYDSGRRRHDEHRAGLPAVLPDAAERRRAEWHTAHEPQDGGADDLRCHARP